MSWKSLVCAGLVCVLASPVMAAPILEVTPGAVVGGNQEWNVSITPDAGIFTANTSIAAEVDFTFGGVIVSAALNDAFWNADFVNNDGNNPFTGEVTEGVWDDNFAAGELFIAAGSELYATATAMPFATITTQGEGGTLSWGGQTVLGGTPEEYVSTRLAQNGQNFDGISGSEDAGGGGLLLGDANNDGQVDGNDLLQVEQSFGDIEPPPPTGMLLGDANDDGQVDGNDLLQVEQSFGDTLGSGSALASDSSAVPEPSAILLFVIGYFGTLCFRRR